MRTYLGSLLTIITFLISTSAYSAWDSQCLNDCFASQHDCGYCEWLCRVEYSRPVCPGPNEYKECPFTGYGSCGC